MRKTVLAVANQAVLQSLVSRKVEAAHAKVKHAKLRIKKKPAPPEGLIAGALSSAFHVTATLANMTKMATAQILHLHEGNVTKWLNAQPKEESASEWMARIDGEAKPVGGSKFIKHTIDPEFSNWTGAGMCCCGGLCETIANECCGPWFAAFAARVKKDGGTLQGLTPTQLAAFAVHAVQRKAAQLGALPRHAPLQSLLELEEVPGEATEEETGGAEPANSTAENSTADADADADGPVGYDAPALWKATARTIAKDGKGDYDAEEPPEYLPDPGTDWTRRGNPGLKMKVDGKSHWPKLIHGEARAVPWRDEPAPEEEVFPAAETTPLAGGEGEGATPAPETTPTPESPQPEAVEGGVAAVEPAVDSSEASTGSSDSPDSSAPADSVSFDHSGSFEGSFEDSHFDSSDHYDDSHFDSVLGGSDHHELSGAGADDSLSGHSFEDDAGIDDSHLSGDSFTHDSFTGSLAPPDSAGSFAPPDSVSFDHSGSFEGSFEDSHFDSSDHYDDSHFDSVLGGSDHHELSGAGADDSLSGHSFEDDAGIDDSHLSGDSFTLDSAAPDSAAAK